MSKGKDQKPKSSGEQRAMAEQRAEDEAVKTNMERLRALRLEREAQKDE